MEVTLKTKTFKQLTKWKWVGLSVFSLSSQQSVFLQRRSHMEFIFSFVSRGSRRDRGLPWGPFKENKSNSREINTSVWSERWNIHTRSGGSAIKDEQILWSVPSNTTQVIIPPSLKEKHSSSPVPLEDKSSVFCLRAPRRSHSPQLQLCVRAGCVSDPGGEEVAECVCPPRPPRPRRSWADLSAARNLAGMTELLRNVSARCLNQPVKMLPVGWACSFVTAPAGSHVAPPALLKYDPTNSKPCPR